MSDPDLSQIKWAIPGEASRFLQLSEGLLLQSHLYVTLPDQEVGSCEVRV